MTKCILKPMFAFSFRMYMPLALVYASFLTLPASTSPATKGNVIQIQVHNIVNLAQTTVAHIRKLRMQVTILQKQQVGFFSANFLFFIIPHLYLSLIFT